MSLVTTWAPGRINLIGEHTDYGGGLVLPAAIQLGLTVDVHKRHHEIRLTSALFGDAIPFPADGSGPSIGGWGRFPQTVAAELDALGRPPVGLEATISSTLPSGTGLSSSAALEVGVALALCAVADFEIDVLSLIAACRRAEERAVGVPCGILDQAACLLGHRDAAVLLDCLSLEHTAVPLPSGAAFLVIDSGVERQLEHSGYADRRRELQTALERIGASSPRELSVHDIALIEPTLRRRLRHVITENERVLQFAQALVGSDLAAAGKLMTSSHLSLRNNYEVSTPELDEIVARANASGAYGARLVGGGFGGSVLALVPADRADEIAHALSDDHGRRRPPLHAQASDGAHTTRSASVSS